MVNIGVEELLRIMPQCRLFDAEKFAAPLSAAMEEFEINTAARQRYFIAQLAHESMQLRYVREIWGPTYQQLRYDGRKDLGNTEPGDGQRFCGRGPIQITGRENYGKCSRALFGDDRLLDSPELLEEAESGSRSAAWFWHSKSLNLLADEGDFARVTYRINGSTRSLSQREVFLTRANEVI